MTRWFAASCLALLLCGCAATPPRPAEGSAGAATPGTRLTVAAPPELARLLEQNLDIARVGRFAREDTIDEFEWSRLIDAAGLQARDLVQTEGYFEPRVQVEREAQRPGEARAVKLTLEPGPRTHVARVTFEVEGELERAASAGDALARSTVENLQFGWTLPPGEPFRNPAWSDAKAAALSRLRALGYANATWSGTGAEIDSEKHEARLFVVADSGPLFRFGQLQIEGLVAHDAETVRHLALFAPGAPVTETMLLDYQERLQKAGLFENVNVTLDPDPAKAGAANVLVRLREAPLQVYTFGLGVSANTGPRTSVEHVNRRLFGYALTARNKVEYGRLRRAWDGEISTHVGEDLYRWLVGGAVEWLESDTDVVLSQRLRFGRARETQREDRLYYVEGERSLRRTSTTRADVVAASVHSNVVWRRLDSIVLPTEGYSLSLQAAVGHSHGSDATSGLFERAYGRLTVYKPLGRTWYGQARIELGQVFLRSGGVAPDSQLFRAGGDDSVRGYSYRSLGPLVDGTVGGGTVLFTGSVELARPISASLPSVWGAVFIDAGRAGNSFGSLKPAWGTGVGIRWRSPVGPLRLDWAWAQELRRSRLHFSVGIAF